MLRWIKRIFFGLIALIVLAFLHYTLPQRDIVRVVGVENRIIDFGENSIFWASPDSGTAINASRDVRFISTIKPNGKPMVYRNEDTGWIWPPYFKYDSSNLDAEAKDAISTAAAPQWVAITHYGWRIEWLTIFPNAVGLRPVEGPDVTLIPWVNITILTALAVLLFMGWRMLAQFRERTIDPLIADAGEAWDAVDSRADAARDRAAGVFGRIGAWFGSWRSKPRR